MAGTVALSILSVCLQGKYRIQGKADWLEPLNTYAFVIATPSERKSAVLNMMLRPLNSYELQYNQRNAAAMESSKMRRRVLERRQKAIEEQVAKGKAGLAEPERKRVGTVQAGKYRTGSFFRRSALPSGWMKSTSRLSMNRSITSQSRVPKN